MSEVVSRDAVFGLVRSANADGERAVADHDLLAADRAFTAALGHLSDLDSTDQATNDLAAAAHLGLGRVALAVDDIRTADLRFDQAQRLRPTSPEGFYWAGCAAAHAANYPRAEWLLSAALALDSRHGNAHLQRAYVRLRQRRTEQALPDLLAAADCQVANDNVRLLIAALQVRHGEAEQAAAIAADIRHSAEISHSTAAAAILDMARYRQASAGWERMLQRCAEGIAAARRGDWAEAAAVLPDHTDGPADDLSLVKAVACGLSGRRAAAAAHLARAVAQAPADHRLSHAQAVLHLHTLSAAEGEPPDQAGWHSCIGAWVSVLHDKAFWIRWRQQAQRRYGCPVSEDAIEAAQTALGEFIEQRLPSDDLALLLRRERAAAALLARVGGLPDPVGPPLVCGPLRIVELGLHRRLSEFARGLAPTDGDTVELFRQFSEIGLAVARLAAGRPWAAATSVLDLRCESCARTGGRTHPAMISEPLMCEPECPEFDARNPAFCTFADKHDELAKASAELAAQTLLDIARVDITKATMDLADARTCWRGAVTLAKRFNQRDTVLREIADEALGRARVLSGRDDLTGAIAVLDAVLATIPAKDTKERDRVATELGFLLNARGVGLFNDDIANAERARADLRRAVTLSPDRPRPRFNLGILLQEMSYNAFREFDTAGAIRLMSESVEQFDIGTTMHDTEKFRHELERTRLELERLLDDYHNLPSNRES